MRWMRLAGPEDAEHIRLAPAACGDLHVEINGALAVLRPSGALHAPDFDVMVAGDLHLEKGSSFARTGQLLPPYDTAATLDALEAELVRLRPGRLVLLGDTFHDRAAAARLHALDRDRLLGLAGRTEVLFVAGNHDPEVELAADFGARALEHLDLGPWRLRHEPRAGAHAGEIAGHLHPCARVVSRGRSVRRRAFLTDGRRLILPAFGAFAGGLNALDAAFRGLFARPPLVAAAGGPRVHPLAFAALHPD